MKKEKINKEHTEGKKQEVIPSLGEKNKHRNTYVVIGKRKESVDIHRNGDIFDCRNS